jgi:hypothetical protein
MPDKPGPKRPLLYVALHPDFPSLPEADKLGTIPPDSSPTTGSGSSPCLQLVFVSMYDYTNGAYIQGTPRLAVSTTLGSGQLMLFEGEKER